MRKFILRDSRVHILDFSIVQHWPDLEGFFFENNLVKEMDLTPFTHHPTLRRIALGGNPVVDLDLRSLLTGPNLTRLSVWGYWGFNVKETLAYVEMSNPPPPTINPALKIHIPSGVEWNGDPAYYKRSEASGKDTVILTTD